MKFKTLAFIPFALAFVGEAKAASIIVDTGMRQDSIVTSQAGGTQDNVVGYQFRVGSQALSVSSLGAWDHLQDGMPGEVIVGLWEVSSASLLASAVVPQGTGGALVGQFRYTDIASPVLLNANTEYVLGVRRSAFPSASNYLEVNFTPTIAPDVNITVGRIRTQESFNLDHNLNGQMPTQNIGSNAIQPLIVGPNMQYQPVPEPATMAALGLGVAALLRRRKK